MEAQLLNVVVARNAPTCTSRRTSRSCARLPRASGPSWSSRTLLDLLSNADGSLLDNIELINTLNDSKITSDEVTESLLRRRKDGKKSKGVGALPPCSCRAAILYFVLYDLATVDPMYQFSLDAYKDLFLLSIEKAPKSEVLWTSASSSSTSSTPTPRTSTPAAVLFEAHKLLLSLQMCVRILQSDNQVNDLEWRFFLRGGMVLDRSDQPPNPAPDWISELAWDNVVELEQQVPHFFGITKSFEQNPDGLGGLVPRERAGEPSAPRVCLGTGSKCDELQRMILVRSLRMDRVEKAATMYVANALWYESTSSPRCWTLTRLRGLRRRSRRSSSCCRRAWTRRRI